MSEASELTYKVAGDEAFGEQLLPSYVPYGTNIVSLLEYRFAYFRDFTRRCVNDLFRIFQPVEYNCVLLFQF